MKAINLKMRSYGIFRAKNRKEWKLSDKTMEAICLFDKIIQEENRFRNMGEQEDVDKL